MIPLFEETKRLTVDPVVPIREDGARGLRYTSVGAGAFLVSATLLTGIAYILAEWRLTGTVTDAIFVSLLVAATASLMIGMRTLAAHLEARGIAFFAFTMRIEDVAGGHDGFRRLWRSVFNPRRMTLAGVAYGLAVSGSPFLLDAWPESLALRVMVAIFLFTVNYATGVAFYALITFFVESIRLGPLVKVDLWHRENPSTTFFTQAARQIALLASVYVSLSLCSIIFSPLPLGGVVYGYSAFAALTIIATLIVPIIPVGREQGRVKQEALLEIDLQIQAEYRQMMHAMKASGQPTSFDKLERILALRQKVESIETWPFKLKSILTSVGVAVISSVPVVVQVLLTRGLAI